MTEEKFSIQILSPEKVIFEGQALSLTCHNEKGIFDILPEHTNFMSMIDSKIIVREAEKKETVIPIDEAILQVVKGHVIIMVHIDVSKKDVG